VLLFPAWFQSAHDGLHGIEASGQRLIFALGQFFVFVFALVPAALVFAAGFFALRMILPWTACVPMAGVAAALTLGVEVALGVVALGKVFERFDLSAEAQT